MKTTEFEFLYSTDADKIIRVEVIGLRKDAKKRKWFPVIEDGILTGGYYGYSVSYAKHKLDPSTAIPGHFVYRAEVTVGYTGRGQSAYYMNMDYDGGSIPMGATGVEILMKKFASNEIELLGNGKFVLYFTLEKTGSQVYAVPLTESVEYFRIGEF